MQNFLLSCIRYLHNLEQWQIKNETSSKNIKPGINLNHNIYIHASFVYNNLSLHNQRALIEYIYIYIYIYISLSNILIIFIYLKLNYEVIVKQWGV